MPTMMAARVVNNVWIVVNQCKDTGNTDTGNELGLERRFFLCKLPEYYDVTIISSAALCKSDV